MTVADPDRARLRVCCSDWRQLYETPFSCSENDLSHARVELLTAQHGGGAAELEASVAQWRALLESRMPAVDELVRMLSALPAPQVLEQTVREATEGLPSATAANDRCWTHPNAESVLIDAGVGVVAHRLGIHAQVRRRPRHAEGWWRCAAVTHHPRAAAELALLARARGDLADASRWWRRATGDCAAPPLGRAADLLPPA
ncbi:hypothetical protein OG226_09605 [Streptomyces sp. NBC_01261]|uniref:hypothetical protein n=1 Tax=unclassified Streptomyces TaxID=2593676 RepID=UPI002E2891AD|nr:MULTISPECIES: hypothetical protein [unclassified Streptomyces]